MYNKIDLIPKDEQDKLPYLDEASIHKISAVTGQGIEILIRKIVKLLDEVNKNEKTTHNTITFS